jgi:Tfp pilus assembly protein PilN
MRRLQIDFAPRGLRRTLFHLTPVVWAGLVLGLILCLAALAGAWQLLQQQRAGEARTRRFREHQAVLAKPAEPVAKIAIPAEQAAAVNAAILKLNLPWRDLQDAVAAATPATVALLALEPDEKKHLLKVSAETRNSDDMIAYIEALKEQEFFSDVLLTKHEISDQDPNKPIRFQLEATWVAR